MESHINPNPIHGICNQHRPINLHPAIVFEASGPCLPSGGLLYLTQKRLEGHQQPIDGPVPVGRFEG